MSTAQPRRSIARVLCLIVIQAAVYWHSSAFSQGWTIQGLKGIVSYHDGINCHGTAMTMVGMNDNLVYGDGIELRYFTEKYCTPKHKRAAPGDLVAAVREGTYEHSGMSLGGDVVFEKESLSGLNTVFDDPGDTSFRIVQKNKSRDFRDCKSPNCKIQVYSCRRITDPAHECPDAALKTIQKIRPKLEALSLNPDPNATFDDGSFALLIELIENLRLMTGQEKCALLALVRSSSTFGHIYVFGFNMRMEPSPNVIGVDPPRLDKTWHNAIDVLRDELKVLREKILKHDSSTQTAKILRESSWIPK